MSVPVTGMLHLQHSGGSVALTLPGTERQARNVKQTFCRLPGSGSNNMPLFHLLQRFGALPRQPPVTEPIIPDYTASHPNDPGSGSLALGTRHVKASGLPAHHFYRRRTLFSRVMGAQALYGRCMGVATSFPALDRTSCGPVAVHLLIRVFPAGRGPLDVRSTSAVSSRLLQTQR
jgi:hypothetical protein